MTIQATDLLSYGYLPKHVPPGFTSEPWGAAVLKHKIAPVKHDDTALIQHNLSRPGTLPRLLALPHPAHYHMLADLCAANWSSLLRISKLSTISLTTPRVGDRSKGERAAEPIHGFPGRASLAIERRSGRRFMLKADVSQCYPSMYTHAFSWAVQGRPAARAAALARGGLTHFSDQIDKAIRDAQERQSVGIPIGPDTSMIIADVLLARVDEQLHSRIKSLSGIRLIDDYELYFESVAQAEQARTYLSHALAEYRLTLNPRKTKVIALPTPLDPDWKHEMSERRFEGSVPQVQRRLRAAADAAFSQRQADPETRAITYLLAMLSKCNFRSEVWPLVQSIALASLEHEENSLPKAARLFLTAHAKGWPIDPVRLGAALNRVIMRDAPLRYGNSVCWAIWLMIKLSLPLGDEAVRIASQMDDAFVLTVLGHAKAAGLAKPLNLNRLARTRNGPGAWSGPDWLCLYEFVQQDWLGPTTKKNVESSLKATPYLSKLNKRGVSFYDPDRALVAISTPRAAATHAPDAHAWATIELLHDY